MKNLFLSFLCILLICCKTIDVEETIKIDTGLGKQSGGTEKANDESSIPDIPYPYNEVTEKPIYVPAQETPPSKPAPGLASVQESNKTGIIKPQDYSHSAMIYSYHSDQVYEVYAQPLRVCDISLQAGETIVEPPFVSDSERWILGAGVSYENGSPVQHIYVKPISSGLSASLIINTDKRVYRIILRSYQETHMPIVRWRYNTGLPDNYIKPNFNSNMDIISGSSLLSNTKNTQTDSGSGFDPRFLSFNYKITHSLFGKPTWLPKLVFDDGSKTFINFPDLVLQRELPTVFENRNNVLNYRVMGNVIVIDKLIDNISVRIGRTEITIRKKRS